jgi:hypothetical protein
VVGVALNLCPACGHAAISVFLMKRQRCRGGACFGEPSACLLVVSDRGESLRWLLEGMEHSDRVRILPKHSLRAVWIDLNARYVFSRTGYTVHLCLRHRVIVNLWHGDGPK